MYLTYDQYEEYGGTLEETTFSQLEFEARAIIDWWTFNRLQKETVYPEAVTRCVFKLISLIADKMQAMVVDTSGSDSSSTGVRAGIMQESNDGVSTTYNTLSAKEAVDATKKELDTTVRMYLSGIKNSLGQTLLYRGLYPNE